MKVFSLNSKMVNDRPVLASATVNLSSDELRLLKYCVETSKKSNNDVLESQRESLLLNFETLLS